MTLTKRVWNLFANLPRKLKNRARTTRFRSNSMTKTPAHSISYLFLTFEAVATQKRLSWIGFIDFFHEISYTYARLTCPSPQHQVTSFFLFFLVGMLSGILERESAARLRKIGWKKSKSKWPNLADMAGELGICLQSFLRNPDKTDSEEQRHDYSIVSLNQRATSLQRALGIHDTSLRGSPRSQCLM